MSDPTDPRRRRTRRVVLAAARAVLRRDGIQGATLDAIAAEAGVARSTLYRNWTDRAHLLDEAIEDAAATGPPHAGDDQIQQIVDVVEHLARSLEQSEWGRTLPAIVAAIDASAELADRYDRFVNGRRSDLGAIVEDARRAGLLPPDLDADDLIDDLVGPLFYRRLVRRTATPPEWAIAHARRTIDRHVSRR